MSILSGSANDSLAKHTHQIYLFISRIQGGNLTRANPEEDEILLVYAGSRWLATVHQKANKNDEEYWVNFSAELHPFWDKIYTEQTVAVSDPTYRQDPIAVDFFRIGQRGQKYGPLGELVPAQTPPGSGYFECALMNTTTVNDFISDVLKRPDCLRRDINTT